MTEYEITTHPDGKQFIRIEDKWMPLEAVVGAWALAKELLASMNWDWTK